MFMLSFVLLVLMLAFGYFLFEHRQLVVCIAVAAMMLLLMAHPSTRHAQERVPRLFDTINTIGGTFIGVCLALYYANANTEVGNKTRVLQLLRAADTDLEIGHRYLAGFRDANTDEATYNRVASEPLRRPELLDSLLANESFVRGVSPQAFAALVSVKGDTARTANNINNARVPFSALAAHLSSYDQMLKYGQDVIALEFKYQSGALDANQLKDAVAHLTEERIKNAPATLRPGMSIR